MLSKRFFAYFILNGASNKSLILANQITLTTNGIGFFSDWKQTACKLNKARLKMLSTVWLISHFNSENKKVNCK